MASVPVWFGQAVAAIRMAEAITALCPTCGQADDMVMSPFGSRPECHSPACIYARTKVAALRVKRRKGAR